MSIFMDTKDALALERISVHLACSLLLASGCGEGGQTRLPSSSA